MNFLEDDDTKKLIRFLKHRNIYFNFMRNFNYDFYLYMVKQYGKKQYSLIYLAFQWDTSVEGFDFWFNEAEKFDIFKKQI